MASRPRCSTTRSRRTRTSSSSTASAPPAGSVERPLGQLAMLAGDLDGAAGHFERALEANAAVGAPLAVANTRRDYAELLRRRGAPGDGSGAPTCSRGPRLLPQGGHPRAGLDGRAAPTVARATAGGGSAPAAVWSVAFRGREAALPAVKGMADLAVLLAQPGPRGPRPRPGRPAAGAAPREGDLGEVIDDRARAAYRPAWHDLDERLADAEADGDADASDQAAPRSGSSCSRSWRRRTASAAAPAVPGDPAERARTTVTSRMRDAIARIDARAPRAGPAPARLGPDRQLLLYAPETADDVGDATSHDVRRDPTPEGCQHPSRKGLVMGFLQIIDFHTDHFDEFVALEHRVVGDTAGARTSTRRASSSPTATTPGTTSPSTGSPTTTRRW